MAFTPDRPWCREPGEWGPVDISPAERTWLDAKHVVRVRVGQWPPYLIATPEPDGIIVEYLRRIGARFDIDFQFLASRENWPAAVESLVRHENFDLLPTMTRTPDRETEIAFTKPFLSAPRVIVTRTGGEFVGGIGDLNGKRVAVQRGYIMAQTLKNDFPELRLHIVDGTENALRAVASGQADAFIGDLPVIVYLVNTLGLTNLKVAAPTPFPDNAQAMGIRSDWPELAGILEKTLAAMPAEERAAIRNRWLSVRIEHGLTRGDILRWTGGVGGIATLIIALILLSNRRLRREISQRQRAERALGISETRYREFMDSAPFPIIIHANLRILYVNRAAMAVFGAAKESELVGHGLLEFVDEAEHDIVRQRAAMIIAQRVCSVLRELRYRRSDGSPLDVLGLGTPTEFGGVAAVQSVFLDVTEKRRVDRALAESERRYRMLVDTAPIAILIHIEGRITFVNNATVRAFGAEDKSELIGRAILDFVHPDDRVIATERMHRIANGRTTTELLEHILFRIDGTPFYVASIGTPCEYDGKPASQIVFLDISQRIKADAALRESEAKFKDFAEISSDWLIETDADNLITSLSPNFYTATGIVPDEVIGTVPFDFFEPEMNEDALDHFRNPVMHREPFRLVNLVMNNAMGSRCHVLVSGRPIHDARNEFLGYRITFREITTEVEALRRQKQVEDRFLEAIELIPIAFALFDPTDRLVFCNRLYREMEANVDRNVVLGTPFEKILRDSVAAGIHGDHGAQAEVWIQDRLDKHRNPGVAFEQHRANQWLRIQEHRASDGSILQVRINVTEQKNVEEYLLRAKEQAEFANQSKSEFLAHMSHELRTPLNSIIGFSEIMAKEMYGPLGSDKYLDYIRDINEAGTNLLALVTDILDISRVEAGVLTLEEGKVDVRKILASCKALFQQRAQKSGIELAFFMPDAPPPLYADERRLKQVLFNLISNALKFTPGSGKVSVHADLDDGGFRFRVIDTGIGIARENFERVLSPFGQVENVMSRNFDGAGLGLPLSLKFVELHGGTLSIDSTPGQGTTITVLLPKSRTIAQKDGGDKTGIAPSSPPSTPASSARISKI